MFKLTKTILKQTPNGEIESAKKDSKEKPDKKEKVVTAISLFGLPITIEQRVLYEGDEIIYPLSQMRPVFGTLFIWTLMIWQIIVVLLYGISFVPLNPLIIATTLLVSSLVPLIVLFNGAEGNATYLVGMVTYDCFGYYMCPWSLRWDSIKGRIISTLVVLAALVAWFGPTRLSCFVVGVFIRVFFWMAKTTISVALVFVKTRLWIAQYIEDNIANALKDPQFINDYIKPTRENMQEIARLTHGKV